MSQERVKPVGIDLGTTFSAIAYVDDGGSPRAIPNAEGAYVTPSAVYIKPDRSIVIGQKALDALSERPDRVAVNFKRDMGEKFYSEPIGGREFSPEALSALVLKKLAQDGRNELGEIGGAVITVPAYFGDARRKATQDAGRIAGLDVLDIINEPTAAALANAFQQFINQGGDQSNLSIARIAARAPSTTMVYDLGGGTFDVTVIRIDHNEFEVIATGGEVRLGGIDFDQRIVNYFCDEFRRRHGIDPRDTTETMERIRSTCELAKIALSDSEQTVLVCEHLGRKMQVPISRPRFEQLTADLIARTQISTEMLLEDAMLGWDRIDNILLVGGSSRIPRVARMLEEISGKKPEMAIAPDQIVSHGAALHAAISVLDRAPQPVTAVGERRMDSESAPQPVNADDEQRMMQAIMATDAVDAAKRIKLADVNSHGLGVIVRAKEGQVTANSVIIPKNTPLPTSRVKLFGTEAKNQRQVRLRITEGDTRDPRGCTQIGECLIRQLPKGLPKGAPVEVSFRYDASGRIQVKAIELTSRISADVHLERTSGFEQEDLNKMKDAVSEINVE